MIFEKLFTKIPQNKSLQSAWTSSQAENQYCVLGK